MPAAHFTHKIMMISDPALFGTATAAAAASFTASALIVLTEKWHEKLSSDSDMRGVQKFHKRPVPRIGGIALITGLFAAIMFGVQQWTDIPPKNHAGALMTLLLAALPAFAAGLLEDLTKKVSVGSRLLATVASALVACLLLDAYLPRLDIWGIDALLRMVPVAIMVTAFAVAGMANSVNIIDGFNGLAGSTVVLMQASMAFLAWQSGDLFVTRLAMAGIGATIGFLLLNYPAGRLFMGDGGAYLLGFWTAEVAVLIVARNPSINAWQILAICAYPIIEVLYSIYRKKFIRKMSPGLPDRLHFHMLVYRRYVCRLVPAAAGRRPWVRNALVTCVVLAWTIPLMVLSVVFGATTKGAIAMVLLQVFLYLAVYTRLVRGHWCLNPAEGFGLLPQHKVKSR
jgi:UDP-N-acetylmuramyl pentapeptide phosphotransferase/UDP-N-acetylglucosamine-1-phosphate transferase